MTYKVKKFGDHRERRTYAKTKNAIELNNLLEIQKKSYDWFITEGIKEVFEDIFPVESFTGNLSLEFGEYTFDEPRYSIKGCKERYATFAAPLKVAARLFNQETGEVKEQEIFLGDMPIMTESGTFVINGAERVIVSQLVRSPSVYFEKEKFVTILEDGTKLNISSKLHETKDFEGMEIMNLQLTENNNTTLLLGEITNTSPNVQGGYLVNIVIIDEQGNEMTTIEAYIKELNPGQSTQLSSKTTLDYANAYDISISRK